MHVERRRPACISAKHEQAIMIRHLRGLTSLKNATLQARMPAFQSHPPFAALPVHPPFVCHHENKKGVSKTTPLVTISLLRNANRLFFPGG